LHYTTTCAKHPDIPFIFAVNDTFDDLFEESGDEEEQDAIVNQVLDEIGLDISGRVCCFFSMFIMGQ
jgi:hypothetical protein